MRELAVFAALLLCLVAQCHGLSAEYFLKETSVLNTNIGIADIYVDLGEDAFLLKTNPCSPYLGCAAEPACPPCDAVTKGDGCATNSPCCPEDTADLCSGDWEELKFDTTTDMIELEQGRALNLRFLVEDPCKGFRLVMHTVYGDAQIYGQSMNPHPTPPNYTTFSAGTELGYPEVVVCPTSYAFEYGTMVYEVTCFSIACKFAMELRSHTVEPKEPVPAACQPGAGAAYCVTETAPLIFVSPIFNEVLVTFTPTGIEECTNYQVLVDGMSRIDSIPGQGWIAFFSLDGPFSSLGQPEVFNTGVGALQNTPNTVLVCPGQTLWISIVPTTGFQFSVSVNTEEHSQEPFKLVPLSEGIKYKLTHIQYTIFSNVQLTCGSDLFTCNHPSSALGIGCRRLTGAVGSPFNYLPFETRKYTQLNPVSLDPFNGQFTLEIDEKDSVLHVAFLLPEWQGAFPEAAMEAYMDTCSLQFLPFSSLVKANKRKFPTDVAIPLKRGAKVACKADKFQKLSEGIGSLVDLLDNVQGLREAVTLRYRIDMVTSSLTWKACVQFSNSLLSSTPVRERLSTDACLETAGTDAWLTDPCCNPDVRWHQCCAARPVDVNSFALAVSPKAVKARCSLPDCAGSLLEDYSFYLQLRSCGAILPPDLNVLVFNTLEFYRSCKQRFLGQDLVGLSCSQDSDCPASACDPVAQRCQWTSAVEEAFLGCVLEEAPLQVRANLESIAGGTVADLLRAVTADNCLTSTGPHPTASRFLTRFSLWFQCNEQPPFSCYDTFCVVPQAYQEEAQYGRPQGVCFWRWILSEVNTRLCEAPTCDLIGVAPEDCEAMKGVCKWCSDDNCKLVDAPSQWLCDSYVACTLANGTTLLVPSEEECAQIFTCSHDCADCASEEGCRAAGECSDAEIYRFFGRSPSDGVCRLGPLNPFNSPDCYVDLSTGPLDHVPFVDGCYSGTDLGACASQGGAWRYGAKTQAECAALGSGCNLPLVTTPILSEQGPEDCETACGGIYQQRFQWRPAVWTGGVVSGRAAWGDAVLRPAGRIAASIDFIKLADVLQQAVVQSFISQLVTQLQCSYNPLRTLIGQVVCDCASGLDHGSACYTGENVALAVADICPGTETLMAAPPAEIVFFDVDSKDCVELQAQLLPTADFLVPPVNSLATTFFPREAERLPYEAVVNKDGRAVGEMLANGVLLLPRESFAKVTRMRICFVLSRRVANSDYTVFDLATVDSSDNLVPLGLTEFTLEQGLLCFEATTPADLAPSGKLLPIVREKEWHSSQNDLSVGEKVTLLVCAVAFLLVALGCVAKFVLCIIRKSNDMSKVCVILLGVICVVRFIHLLLLGIEEFDPNANDIPDFLLVEVPLLFYLSIFVLLALGLVRVLLSGSHRPGNIYLTLWLPWAIACLVLAIILGVTIAVYTALDDTGIDTITCGSRVLSTANSSSNSGNNDIKVLRIVYKSVLTALALMMGGIVALLGCIFFSQQTRARRSKMDFTVILVMVLPALGLVASGIAFIIYFIVDEPTPYFAWVLLVTEVIPITLMLSLMQSKGSNGGSSISGNATVNTRGSPATRS